MMKHLKFNQTKYAAIGICIFAILITAAVVLHESPRSICEDQGKVYIGDGICISQIDALGLIRAHLNL